MAWLLFLDESGHDHVQMPYEVRGGVAIQDSQLWPFTRAMQQLERDAFGCSLHEFQKELKGSTLLDKNRFKFANQTEPMSAAERQKHSRLHLLCQLGVPLTDATHGRAGSRGDSRRIPRLAARSTVSWQRLQGGQRV